MNQKETKQVVETQESKEKMVVLIESEPIEFFLSVIVLFALGEKA